jgi:hypothetical protein
MHMKQCFLDDLTTNEAINLWRYDYLKNRSGSPWHRGIFGNILEFYAPTQDWSKVFEAPHSSKV